nr:hypothetical protein [Tanacetum cinerariifolium]
MFIPCRTLLPEPFACMIIICYNLVMEMVNTRTDAELASAVQNALQTLLPHIRSEIREEFRTDSGPSGSGGNPPIVCMILALYRAKKEWKPRVLGDEEGLVKQGGDEVFAWGTRVQVKEVVTRWLSPYIGVTPLPVSYSLQALSNLHYLFGGFMDYLWSRELDISNFDPADRKILPVDARATGAALGIILIWNSTWRAGGKPDDQSFTVDGDVDDFLVTDNSSMILG